MRVNVKKTHAVVIAVACSGALALAFVRGSRPPLPAAAENATKTTLRNKPKTSREFPTTSADIYLGNLDAHIEELTRLTNEHPDILTNLQGLSAAHHERGRFRDDLDEIQLGIDLASTCTKREPEDGTCFLMRAQQEQSLHRFKEARADLERARALGIPAARTDELAAELDWNDGAYDKAIAAIRKARRDRPSTATWMREAQLEHDLGQDEASDAAFEHAEDLIVDTSPLPLAHLYLQRGIQNVDRGLLEQACVFFREAAARLPTYVAANEHLAETLHALGKHDEAATIYEKVVQLSTDPEFLHALADVRASQGRAEEARALDAKARERYEALLAKYPEAMYWHAAEFYLATGDANKAAELLRANLGLRPNSTSYVALARAELACGHTAEAKQAIDTALGMPVRSAMLFWTASRVYRGIGDVGAANAYRDRATRANPRIEESEH